MFIYNFKFNKKIFFKVSIIIMVVIALFITIIAFYNILKKDNLNGCTNPNEILEVTSDNYTNILKSVNENVDSYIGAKVHFTGYIYRLIDFDETEFVLARDMVVDKNNNEALIVGFLCTYPNASQFDDNTWVDVTGTIIKGNYHGDVALVKVSNIFEIAKPESPFVYPPDNTYISTSFAFN